MFKHRVSPITNVLLFALLVFSINSCNTHQPILIGFASNFTGLNAALAIEMRDGALMAVEEINQAGGIVGRDIQLLIEDDRGTPEGAKEADNKLIDAGVVAIIGHETSNLTLAGYEVTEARNTVLFSLTGSTSQLSGKKDLFFRITDSSDYRGRVTAYYAFKERELTRMAIIYDLDISAYSLSLSQTFTKTFNDFGGKVVKEIGFSEKSNPDYDQLVDELITSDAQGIYIIASTIGTATISQIIRLKGWKPQLFGAGTAVNMNLINYGGKAVEGMEFVALDDTQSSDPDLIEFKERFYKRFARDFIYPCQLGYDGMHMLAAALEKTGGKAEGLAEALLALDDYQGLTESIDFNEYGDVVRQLYAERIVDGKFKTIMAIPINE